MSLSMKEHFKPFSAKIQRSQVYLETLPLKHLHSQRLNWRKKITRISPKVPNILQKIAVANEIIYVKTKKVMEVSNKQWKVVRLLGFFRKKVVRPCWGCGFSEIATPSSISPLPYGIPSVYIFCLITVNSMSTLGSFQYKLWSE